MTNLLQNNNYQEQNRPLIFGDQQIKIKCPFCLQQIQSKIIQRPQSTAVLISLLSLIIFPIITGIICTIIILRLGLIKKHQCSNCMKDLGTNGKFLFFFQDKVYSCNLYKTGIIVSKKSIFSLILIIFIFYVYRNSQSLRYQKILINQDSTSWQEFHRKCSKHQLKITKSRKQCRDLYMGHTFLNWQGFIMRIEDNRNSIKKYYNHAVKIYIKMHPQQKKQKPQIILNFDSQTAKFYQKQIDDLRHGDQVIFNATIKNFKPKTMRYVHAVDIARTGQSKNGTNYYLYQQQIEQFSHLRDHDVSPQQQQQQNS